VATVVFFISGHGFGHASREVEVINALGAARPDVRVLIRTAASPTLLARTLRVRHELRTGPCDTGIVQSSSIRHDDAATVREAVAFYSDFARRIDEETAALDGEDVRLVVADIPPVAFEVAVRLGTASVAIGNFTWDWIYDTHPGLLHAAPWIPPLIRGAYAKATLALELPFSGGFDVFRQVHRLPLIARRPTRSRNETRRHFRIPRDRPAVLLSFGGYGMPSLDVSRVDCPDWTLVVTDRVLQLNPHEVPGHIVFVEEQQFISSRFRYEDLVAAADVVMSKPGYGIVSECIACDTPLLYTSRGDFREYDIFVRDMPRYLRCKFLEPADLFSGRWAAALEALRAQSAPPETMSATGAEDAVAALVANLNA
jgi:L-arabinokinase